MTYTYVSFDILYILLICHYYSAPVYNCLDFVTLGVLVVPRFIDLYIFFNVVFYYCNKIKITPVIQSLVAMCSPYFI